MYDLGVSLCNSEITYEKKNGVATRNDIMQTNRTTANLNARLPVVGKDRQTVKNMVDILPKSYHPNGIAPFLTALL